jgi:hypothetical protein
VNSLTKIQMGCLGALALGVILALSLGMQFIGINNRETELRVAAKRKTEVNRTVHDTMKQIIFGQAGVATAYVDKFDQVYTKLVASRFQDTQLMMKFVQEANPSMDTSLYRQVSNSIAEQRAIFQENQRQLISIAEEHERLIKTFPGNVLLAGREPIEVQIVTSADTEKAFATGRDDSDPNPFSKKE